MCRGLRRLAAFGKTCGSDCSGQIIVIGQYTVRVQTGSPCLLGSDWIVMSSRYCSAFPSRILFSSRRSLVQVVLSGGEENALQTHPNCLHN